MRVDRERRAEALVETGTTEHQTGVLSAHRFASHAARDRHLVPWLVAVVLHTGVVYILGRISFKSGAEHRDPAILIRAEHDNPPAIIAPVPSPTAAAQETAPQQFAEPAFRGSQTAPVPRLPYSNTAGLAGQRISLPSVATGIDTLGRTTPNAAGPRLFTERRSSQPSSRAVTLPSAALDRIRIFNDSAAAFVLAKKRARDWTVKDSSGNRWGAANGVLYLGPVSIPLMYMSHPDSTPDKYLTAAGRRDEMRARLERWNEIELQAGRAVIRAAFAERVGQIRERRDATRMKAMADSVPRKR